MEITTENASALCGHQIQSQEKVVGQFIVFVSGHPNGSHEEVNEGIRKLLVSSILENRSALSNLVSSLHVKLEVFEPEEYFGAIAQG